MTLLLFISQAPVVFLFTWIYLRDKNGREPISLLIKTTLIGGLICLPVGFLELFLSELTDIDETSTGLPLLFYSLILVAAVEEGAKFLILRFYNYHRKEFDEPYDGIMYAVAVSLGFAAVENIAYVLPNGYAIGIFRGITAVPMHALTAVLMGYFVGRAKFSAPSDATHNQLKGLTAAIVVHGIYDYGAFTGQLFFLLAILIIELRLARNAIRIHQEYMASNNPGSEGIKPGV